MTSQTLNNFSILAGRILISAIFISAGISKIGGYVGTQGYMEQMGVPGILLPAVIALEILGGVAIVIGFQTRIAAVLLAAFTLVTTAVFHSDFSDQIQMILFMKNLAISGAFLLLFAQGPGQWALDSRKHWAW